ncbi:hypothetical protein [Caminibacter mediatlanticus]|uniref:hypothetical protein n=1 Tax=Caminibacter mediatlanticus TaxID=291048 RepID=UPI0012EACF9F|nr:hypothetical protein [Caminibacter mediatlanticus]
MLKIISLLLISSLLFGIEIFATKAKKINNTILLTKPLIIYKNFIVQSKKGKIVNKIIYLNDDVIAFYQNSTYKAQSAVIYHKNDIKIKDILLLDKSNDIWIKAKNVIYKNNIFNLKNIKFSSCCLNEPDWFLYSTSGIYNKKTKYIRLYNLKLYVHNVPVLYFPFYFNSLNKQRRTGLLRPYVGFSAKEGFLYSQPFYIVLGDRADFEITPTIRSFRGRGVYNTFRFVTSPYDFGTIKFGEFIDFDKYYKKYNLANKKHYGYQIIYKRDKVFNNDKLYLNFKYANDVDYFYLNSYNYTFNTKYLVDKLITSKLNYIKSINKDYLFGLYGKYFIDTTKLNNDNTIQILPQLNFHKFETKNHKILNSFDLNVYNYYSKYKKYYKIDTNIPLAYNLNLFNDYLNITLSENFNYLTANYYNSQTPPQRFYQLYSSIKFHSSLAKKNNYTHIINPSLTFNIKQFSNVSKNNDLLDYTKIDNSINLSLFQIFEKGDFYLDHTINQNFNLNLKTSSLLENIFNVKYKQFSISDTNKYDYKINRAVYNNFSFSFPIYDFNFKLTHIYNYPANSTISQSYTLHIDKKSTKYKKYYFEYNYDIENKYYKYILFGTKLNKKCWQYDFALKKERIPVLKDNGISYNNNYMIIFNINFYPIGGLQQSIQLR